MSKVRTRFAPSPTGRMHVGNLRTALYAYLITKHEGGDFILRIEDTDQERYVEGAVEIIYRTLKETGLIHDEGPDKDGGCGPYVQSERQAQGIYLKYAKELIDKGFTVEAGRERGILHCLAQLYHSVYRGIEKQQRMPIMENLTLAFLIVCSEAFIPVMIKDVLDSRVQGIGNAVNRCSFAVIDLRLSAENIPESGIRHAAHHAQVSAGHALLIHQIHQIHILIAPFHFF